jgi:hypothetical protein
LLSRGHDSPNVSRRACIIASDMGSSSLLLGSPVRRRMHVTTAKPQFGECVRCSYAGTSFSSQPSNWQWHEKHWTLSGLAVVGFQTNPAKARSCADGRASGQAFFDLEGTFFVFEDVRLDLEVAGALKVSIRACRHARLAAIALTSWRWESVSADVNVSNVKYGSRSSCGNLAVPELDCGRCCEQSGGEVAVVGEGSREVNTIPNTAIVLVRLTSGWRSALRRTSGIDCTTTNVSIPPIRTDSVVQEAPAAARPPIHRHTAGAA